jgi:hypothetical protein
MEYLHTLSNRAKFTQFGTGDTYRLKQGMLRDCLIHGKFVDSMSKGDNYRLFDTGNNYRMFGTEDT